MNTALDANTLKLLEPGTWIELNPSLHIADDELARSVAPLSVGTTSSTALLRQLITEGYFHLTELQWGLAVPKLGEAINRLHVHGIHPPFAFVYDEFWLPFIKLYNVMSALLGPDYRMLPDFWAWRIDPGANDHGWRPHRDKGRRSLREDGTPKSLTFWIALSDATPLNGCMYIVPANRDPHYNTAQENAIGFDLADIRALPARAGDVFCWNQAVYHWGSRAVAYGGHPRISMAFEFQRADEPAFNRPLLDPLQLLDFASRLKLIAKQVLQYQHMYALPQGLKQFAENCLRL